MKKLLCVIVIILFCNNLYASIDNLIHVLSNIQTLYSHITLTEMFHNTHRQIFDGYIYNIRNDKMLIDIYKPYNRYIYVDNKRIYDYDDIDKVLNISQDIKYFNLPNIIYLFLLKSDNIKDNFDIVTFNNNHYKLYPKENIDIQYIEIFINNGAINKIKAEDKRYNKVEIELDNVKINKTFDPEILNVFIPEGTKLKFVE